MCNYRAIIGIVKNLVTLRWCVNCNYCDHLSRFLSVNKTIKGFKFLLSISPSNISISRSSISFYYLFNPFICATLYQFPVLTLTHAQQKSWQSTPKPKQLIVFAPFHSAQSIKLLHSIKLETQLVKYIISPQRVHRFRN